MPADFSIAYTSIELVHPPFSSHAAVEYERSKDPELEEVLRSSNLYMVGGRPEATFGGFEPADDGLWFDIVMGGEVISRCLVDVYALDTVERRRSEAVDLEYNGKYFRIWERDGEDTEDLLDWFTVDKLVWDHTRGWKGLEGVVVPQSLVTFDLLYVGIANVTDSYDRLLARGHKAKGEILAREPQRFPGARVSDEIYFFLLRPEPIFIRTIGDDWTPDPGPPIERVVADLEKAFISQLGPEYNRTRYSAYPAGKDGLADAGLDRYGYAIAENLTFRTAMGEFRGQRDMRTGLADLGDLLFVEGTEVTVVSCGPEAPTETADLD